MNTLQTVSTILSMLCLVITTVLAWLMLTRTSKTEVSFTGTPMDKKEFERHEQENKHEHEKIIATLSGVERGVETRLNAKLDAMQAEAKADREKLHFRINPIEAEICALRHASETNTTRLVQMDGKIDRLVERMSQES
jgi:hypothetical protein